MTTGRTAQTGTPVDDSARLAYITATDLVGGTPSPALQRLTDLASRLLDAPVSMVSLILDDRQVVPASTGPVEKREYPLSHSFCRHVVASGRTLVAGDARVDPTLAGNPAIADYQAIAYLGAPLRAPDRTTLGTLCVFDNRPREWSGRDVAIVEDLAVAAGAEIAARLAASGAARVAARWQRILDTTLDAFIAVSVGDDRDGIITGWNLAAKRMFGYSEAEAIGQPLTELIVPAELRDAHRAEHAKARETGDSMLAGRRIEVTALHRTGRVFPAELAMTLSHEPDGPTFHFFARDISERKRTQQLRDAEQAVASALLQDGTAEQMAREVVTRLGERLDWPFVEYWHRTAEDAGLERLAVHAGDPGIAGPMEVSGPFAAGVGVPGTVWATGSAQWIADVTVSSLVRAAAARRAGLRTVAAVPVRDGADVVGVLLIADRRQHDSRDDELVASLESVSAHIGQAVQRRRAAELREELAATRDDLARVVDNINDFLWTVQLLPDGDSRTVFAQGNFAAILGADRQTATGGHDLASYVVDNIHPADRAVHRRFTERLRAGEPAEFECRVAGADGVTRWIWTRAVPRREGDQLFVDGLCSDVTARHEAKAVADRQAELLRLAPIAVIVRDLQSRIIGWNIGAERTYGWPATTAIGKSSDRLLDTRPADGSAAVDTALAADGRWEGELDQLSGNGTRIIVHSHQAVQYDDGGAPSAILEVNLDVTARRQAETALAGNERMLRAQFALSTVGQALLHVDGTVLQANPALADILGYRPDALAGRTLDSVTHPDDRHLNRASTATLFADDVTADRRQRLIAADGQVVDVQIGMSLLRDDQGRPATIITAVADISARVAAERERDVANRELEQRNAELEHTNTALADADAVKRDLMGILSHEISTPLTTIGGYAETLLAGAEGLAPAQQKAITAIARSVTRLDALCREVLDVCKSEGQTREAAEG